MSQPDAERDLPSSIMDGIRRVADEAVAERVHQILDLGHSAEHDDQQPLAHWSWLLSKRSVELSCPVTDAIPDPRRELLEIAAVAMAALESFDRQAETSVS